MKNIKLKIDLLIKRMQICELRERKSVYIRIYLIGTVPIINIILLNKAIFSFRKQNFLKYTIIIQQ